MKLRYGLIGGAGGFIGDVHRRAATADCLAELVAGIFSRNMEKNLRQAKEWGVQDESRVYKDYKEMAEKESQREDGVDFISVTTPNDTHYEIAKCFLEHGINVMCDKPLTLTVEQAKDLKRIADEKGLQFGVTFTFTGYTMLHQAKAMIDKGAIGEIMNIHAEFPLDFMTVSLIDGQDSGISTWRQDPARSGPTGCCGDICTHVIAAIHEMTGLYPERLIARFNAIPREIMKLDTEVDIMCDFEGDVPGTVWASQVAGGFEVGMTIKVFGTQGAMEWTHLKPWELKYTKVNEPTQLYTCSRTYLEPGPKSMCRLPAGHYETFYETFMNIYRGYCMNLIARKTGGDNGGFTYPTVEDGVKSMEFIEACIKSNNAGNTWVKVGE